MCVRMGREGLEEGGSGRKKWRRQAHWAGVLLRCLLVELRQGCMPQGASKKHSERALSGVRRTSCVRALEFWRRRSTETHHFTRRGGLTWLIMYTSPLSMDSRRWRSSSRSMWPLLRHDASNNCIALALPERQLARPRRETGQPPHAGDMQPFGALGPPAPTSTVGVLHTVLHNVFSS